MTQAPRDIFNPALDAITTLLGAHPVSIGRRLPSLDCDPSEIATSGFLEKIETREAYLAWVSDYKAAIALASDNARSLKALRCSGDFETMVNAQAYLSQLRRAITVAIHARRLGKIWSRSRAIARQQAAA